MSKTRVRAHWRRRRGGKVSGFEILVGIVLILLFIAIVT